MLIAANRRLLSHFFVPDRCLSGRGNWKCGRATIVVDGQDEESSLGHEGYLLGVLRLEVSFLHVLGFLVNLDLAVTDG